MHYFLELICLLRILYADLVWPCIILDCLYTHLHYRSTFFFCFSALSRKHSWMRVCLQCSSKWWFGSYKCSVGPLTSFNTNTSRSCLSEYINQTCPTRMCLHRWASFMSCSVTSRPVRLMSKSPVWFIESTSTVTTPRYINQTKFSLRSHIHVFLHLFRSRPQHPWSTQQQLRQRQQHRQPRLQLPEWLRASNQFIHSQIHPFHISKCCAIEFGLCFVCVANSRKKPMHVRHGIIHNSMIACNTFWQHNTAQHRTMQKQGRQEVSNKRGLCVYSTKMVLMNSINLREYCSGFTVEISASRCNGMNECVWEGRVIDRVMQSLTQ